MRQSHDRPGHVTVARLALTLGALWLAGPAHAQILGTTDEITQHGITFSFDQAYTYGQFANGDYWVAPSTPGGAVNITGMSPGFTGTANGWMVNPTSNAQSWDNEITSFNASLAPSLPYDAGGGESILKAISVGHWPSGVPATRYSSRDVAKLETMAVLTVLDEAPVDGGETLFRPWYMGHDKPFYSTNDLQLDLLPSLSYAGSRPNLDSQVRRWERVQVDHNGGWQGRQYRPRQNMHDYGAETARESGATALRLMLDDPVEQKMPLLVNYVQYGLDLYGAMQNGTTWPPNGGHALGRKLPMVFAAVMLGDEQMKSDILSAPANTFHEDGSVQFTENAMTTLFGHPGSESMYWLNQNTGSGSRTVRDPYGYIDGGQTPGGSYQFCCNSMPFKGAALALHLMPELRDIFDNEEYLDYVDRWVNHGAWTLPDPYKANGDGEIDGVGRYPHLHGSNADSGHYGSGFVNAMWNAFRDGPAVMMPFIAPFGGGTFDEPVSVELLAPHQDDVQIRYTLDGSTPTEDSPLYTGAFLVGPGEHVLSVRGFKAGHHSSAVNTVELSVAGLLGDMNHDGVVDTGDVAAFVLALTDPAAYIAQFNVSEATMIGTGDINRDGVFDTGDVAAFVSLLVDGPNVPEPATAVTLAFAGLALLRRRRCRDTG